MLIRDTVQSNTSFRTCSECESLDCVFSLQAKNVLAVPLMLGARTTRGMLKTVDMCALLSTIACEATSGEEEAKEHHCHSGSG